MAFKNTVLTALSVVALLSSVSLSMADTSDKRMALSNNYAGNSWRQAMLKNWEETAGAAVKAGIIGQADAFTTAESQATEQAAQIQNLILQGYDAIILNAASPTALNGAVKEACDAGIIVVSFDGIVTEPCAWRIVIDYKQVGMDQVNYLAKRFPEGGNLLEIRGISGVSVDAEIHAGVEEGIAKHPNFKIVRSVNGDWSSDVAQRAVAGILPSLPDVVGVVAQGGDGYGAAQAFIAAKRPVPVIIMGNRHDELQWWKEQKDATGYETTSATVAPGIVGVAFWVAQQILDGKEVKKDIVIPALAVTQDNLDETLKSTPVGGVADRIYSQEDTIKFIEK